MPKIVVFLQTLKGGGSGANASNHKHYEINVIGDFDVPGTTNTFGGVEQITVTLKGDSALRLLGTGSILDLDANQTVIMIDTDLVGVSSNLVTLVYVDGPGTFFTMKGSASISGNNATADSWSAGGGVYVRGGAVFIMEDHSSVHDNKATAGAGVNVGDSNMIMRGNAFIHDNEAVSGGYGGIGGGVCVSGNDSTFTMEGNASIYGNKAVNGGGVYVKDGATFTVTTPATETGNVTGNTSNDVVRATP